MTEEAERGDLPRLLRDVEALRRQLDDSWYGARDATDEKLDMAFAELHEMAAPVSGAEDEESYESRLRTVLEDMHRALGGWRLRLESSRDLPSEMEGTVRELQDRIMKLIVAEGRT